MLPKYTIPLLCLAILTAAQALGQITAAASGYAHTMFVRDDHSLWGFGSNTYGQLGTGDTVDRAAPWLIATEVKSVWIASTPDSGAICTIFLKLDNSLWGMGVGPGLPGYQTKTKQTVPTRIATGVTAAACDNHLMYVTSDGTLWGVGANSFGQLGDGTMAQRITPVSIAAGVRAVSVGNFFTMFIKNDGSLWAMGVNNLGQFGIGNTLSYSIPIEVAKGVAQVSLGDSHSVILKTDGSVWTSGNNYYGQLGAGDRNNGATFTRVATDASSVSASSLATLFLKNDGQIWAMGIYNGVIDPSPDQLRPASLYLTASLISSGMDNKVYVGTDGSLRKLGGTVILPAGVAPPVITSQPNTQLAPAGVDLIFAATATGTALSYQWQKNGAAISGATSNILELKAISASSAGSYSVLVSNAAGTVASNVATLTVQAALAPVITGQPVSRTAAVGATVVFSVAAVNPGLTYQWQKDGANISGATLDTLELKAISASSAGSYSALIANAVGKVASNAATLTVGFTSALTNLSVRTAMSTGQTLIVGAVVSGGNKVILARAGGPALNQFGLPGMADPRVELYTGGSAPSATNDNWANSLAATFARVGAFGYNPGSNDAALSQTLAGSFTVQARGTGAGTVLVELYDVTGGNSIRLVNVSARNRVGTGADVLIAGFAISGNGNKNLLIRGIGPSLAQFGLTATLADPKIQVYDAKGAVIASNDNWDASLANTFASVGAFGMANGSKDAALVVSLTAGTAYTVVVSGADLGTGEALVEVYEL